MGTALRILPILKDISSRAPLTNFCLTRHPDNKGFPNKGLINEGKCQDCPHQNVHAGKQTQDNQDNQAWDVTSPISPPVSSPSGPPTGVTQSWGWESPGGNMLLSPPDLLKTYSRSISGCLLRRLESTPAGSQEEHTDRPDCTISQMTTVYRLIIKSTTIQKVQ